MEKKNKKENPIYEKKNNAKAGKGKKNKPKLFDGKKSKSQMPVKKQPQEYRDEFYVDEWQMKRRRKQQQRELRASMQKQPMTAKQRKIKNIFIYAAILLIVLVVGVTLSLTVLFNSDTITVAGSLHYSDDEIISASSLQLGENLFLSNKSNGEKQIVEKFPYVEKAEIGVKIPSTFTINITEATPAYLIQSGAEYVIISSKGRILEKITDKSQYNIPVLSGFKISDDNVGTYINLKDANTKTILDEVVTGIKQCEITGVTEIDMTNTANVSITFSDRIKIIIGTPEDIPYKLKTAKIIIDEKLENSDVGTLDVSMCNTEQKKSYFRADHSTSSGTADNSTSSGVSSEQESLPPASSIAGIAGLANGGAVYTPAEEQTQQTTQVEYTTEPAEDYTQANTYLYTEQQENPYGTTG